MIALDGCSGAARSTINRRASARHAVAGTCRRSATSTSVYASPGLFPDSQVLGQPPDIVHQLRGDDHQTSESWIDLSQPSPAMRTCQAGSPTETMASLPLDELLEQR